MTLGPVTVAVDAMGGDEAPEVILDGVTSALASDETLEIALVGTPQAIQAPAEAHERVTAVPASQVVTPDEHPARSLRAKKDSSVAVGCRLVRSGDADAFFSAGSTGAVMAAATLHVGRVKGISRPAIATVIPTGDSATVLLDVGANADCKPENLLDFARLGSAYATAALGVTSPRVGLLNIGEEDSKGSTMVQEAHALLRRDVAGFVGNVEGRDIPRGTVDVVVTDGFTGNVCVKLMEGLSRELLSAVREAMTSTTVRSVAAKLLHPALRDLRARLAPETYGGAPLLGVDGVVLIGHGSSNVDAAAAGILMSARVVRAGMIGHVRALADS